MKKVSLARKYTRALAETLKDSGEYQKIKDEIDTFINFVSGDKKLKAGLETVLFSYAQKMDILKIFGSGAGLSEKTFNFLSSLAENNRLPYLPMISEMIEDVWYEVRGVEKFELLSAVELEPEQEDRLRSRLQGSLKKEVVFDKRTDPSLIAGIKLRKGSVYYDFSIEGNLKKLRESLTGDDSR